MYVEFNYINPNSMQIVFNVKQATRRLFEVWKIKKRYLNIYVRPTYPSHLDCLSCGMAVMSGLPAAPLLCVVWGINEVVAHKGDPSAPRQF